MGNLVILLMFRVGIEAAKLTNVLEIKLQNKRYRYVTTEGI